MMHMVLGRPVAVCNFELASFVAVMIGVSTEVSGRANICSLVLLMGFMNLTAVQYCLGLDLPMFCSESYFWGCFLLYDMWWSLEIGINLWSLTVGYELGCVIILFFIYFHRLVMLNMSTSLLRQP
jgi:hypothetical protein